MHAILNEVHWPLPWTSIAALVFGLVFFIVGLSRVVEFTGIGLSDLQRHVFSLAHIVGCVLFFMAFVLLAIDVQNRHKDLLSKVLFSALAIFFPVHIYIGLKRRIILRDQMEKKLKS